MTELPKGWVEVRTDEAGRLDLGRQRSPKYHDGPNMKPYLRVANVFEDRIDASDLKTMHFEPAAFERSRLHRGDVLLNEGQSPEWLGRPAIYRGDPPDVAFTNSLIRFKPNEAVTSEWALAVFRHHMHSGRFARESRITTNIAHLSVNRLAGVEFPVPPRAEQERIVAAIEEGFSKLDAGEAGLRRVRQLIKRMRDSTLAAAVTGRLVSQDREDGSATNALVDAGIEPIHDGRLEALPHGWTWATVESIAAPHRHALAIGPFGSSLKVVDYAPEGVPLVFVRNIRLRDFTTDTKFVSHEKADELSAHLVRKGDVLVTKMGDPPGDAAVYPEGVPAIITADCIKVSCGRAMLPDFLVYAVACGETRRGLLEATRGVAQKKVSLGRFRVLPVPVPPIEEQRRIVAEVDRELSSLDACDRAVDAGLARSAALRRSVLKAAFEGQLVAQDPTDEPASTLLERIRASHPPTRPTRRAKAKA